METNEIQTPATTNDVGAERGILAAILATPEVLHDLTAILPTGSFYSPRHRVIYQALLDMTASGDPVDSVLLGTHLARKGDLQAAGGAGYVSDLEAVAVPPGAALLYATSVTECARARAVARVGYDLTTSLAGGTASEAASAAQAALEVILTGDTSTTRTVSAAAAFESALDSIDADDEPIIATGLTDLDRALNGGLRPRQMTLVLARFKVGKTVFACQTALAASIGQGKRGLFVTVEMDIESIMKRMLSARCGIPYNRILNGKDPVDGLTEVDWNLLARESKVWNRSGRGEIVFMSTESHGVISVDMITAEAKRLHRNGGLDYVIVDYLQLIKPARGSRREDRRDIELGLISQELRLLAKQLRVPVLVTGQLNRQAADAMPRASHLRESDTPAADADCIILMHDPAHTGDDRPGELDLIIDKNRSGPSGITVPVAAMLHYQRLGPLAHMAGPIPRDYTEPREIA